MRADQVRVRPQLLERLRVLAFHGADRAAQRLGHLRLGEVFEMAQHDDGPLPRRQATKRVRYRGAQFHLVKIVARRGTIRQFADGRSPCQRRRFQVRNVDIITRRTYASGASCRST